MAAPMRGFSEHPVVLDVEIGHKLGLRWFRIDEERHGDVSVTAHRDAPAVAQCSCGSSAAVGWANWDAWLSIHHVLRAGLSLHGAVGKWQPGENVATCKHPDTHARMGGVPGEVPHEECGCGFWAYWKLGPKQVQPPTAAAIIKGYGDIIEGGLGFRCSHAKIIAVVPTAYDPTTALNLEDAGYDVYSSLGAMLEMIKAPEGQPPLTIGDSGSPFAAAGGSSSNSFAFIPPSNPGAVASGAGGNSSFHGMGGSGSGTWHTGGTVTYGGGGSYSYSYVPPVPVTSVASQGRRGGKTTETVAALRALRLAAWNVCKALADLAAAANRGFTPAEQASWDEWNEKMDEYDRKIKNLLG